MTGMFDRDRSGSIELHEFQALWTYIGQWRQIFDQYDRDRSGAIDGNELHNSKFILPLYSACIVVLTKISLIFQSRSIIAMLC